MGFRTGSNCCVFELDPNASCLSLLQRRHHLKYLNLEKEIFTDTFHQLANVQLHWSTRRSGRIRSQLKMDEIKKITVLFNRVCEHFWGGTVWWSRRNGHLYPESSSLVWCFRWCLERTPSDTKHPIWSQMISYTQSHWLQTDPADAFITSERTCPVVVSLYNDDR